ncbi:MAG: NUDIX domain-containing protein [Ignavibacteria bacterium]|nr:NUDIX domain-containing protein [Ignavibacteria bacterium]
MANFVANTIQVHIAAWDSRNMEYKFLALKRSKNNPIYPEIWQAITGTIEGKETAIECAIREVKEETGLQVKEIWTVPFVAIFFDPYQDAVNASPVFGVVVDFSETIKISPEHETFQWLTLEKFIELVPLPSHKIGAKYFWEHILQHKEKEMFKYINKEIKKFE